MLLALVAGLPCLAFDHSHKEFSRDLRAFVQGGRVRYRKWKENDDGLSRYMAALAGVSAAEFDRFSESQKKAFWINAYNAITIRLVLDHYPINGKDPAYPANSLRQIPNVWEDYSFKVAGRDVTLEALEHNVLRQFNDPRLHFAVVCAAMGAPLLKDSAYVAETLEADLEAAARLFFANPANVDYDPARGEIRVSRLFFWFPLDFASAAGINMSSFPPPKDEDIVLAYVLSRADESVRRSFQGKQARVSFKKFDWALNDAAAFAEPAKD